MAIHKKRRVNTIHPATCTSFRGGGFLAHGSLKLFIKKKKEETVKPNLSDPPLALSPGQRLRRAREKKGFTQMELALRLTNFRTVSVETIDAYETDAKLPNDYRLTELAIVLDTTFDYLKYGI